MEDLVSGDTVHQEKKRQNALVAEIEARVKLFDKTLLKEQQEEIVEILQPFPAGMQIALCPLSNHNDPFTSDPLESLFSLSRQIDKIILK